MTAAATDLSRSLEEARSLYFAANQFGDDGGYSKRWVSVKLGFLSFTFPNSAARVRAVRFHDLHHIVTGYETTFTGEVEISSWEIGSGCADMIAAWYLNLGAMGWGAFVAPRRAWRAFLRGRSSRNLYRARFDDQLLATTVSEARARLGLAESPRPGTATDAFLFGGAMALGLGLGTAMFVAFTPLAIASALVGAVAARRQARRAAGG